MADCRRLSGVDVSSGDVATSGTPADPAALISIRVVVVTWEGAHLLRPCLDALLGQTVPRAEMEIVVVDNASTDDTEGLMAREYPELVVRRSRSNLGFAGGANLGLEGFEGDFVALVNNDATLAPDAIEQMRAVLEAPGAELVAAVTAKVVLAGTYRPGSTHERDRRGALTDGHRWFIPVEPGTPDGLRLLNSTGNIVRKDGTGGDRGWLERDTTSVAGEDVFGFCGGAALLRRKALDDVGPFDSGLFLYYEDTDLSWRLRSRGWQIRYAPEAVATHLHAASSGTTSPMFRYYNTRNSLIVFTRHAPISVVALSALRQCIGFALSAAHHPGSPLTRARARALLDFARALPRALHDRRRLWRSATVSRRTVATYLC